MKISFIVPVYNVEKYLHECAKSILDQLTADCELILVDDGSKDQSGIICDEIEAKHDNVKVIHKENGGHSSARNAGLEIAEGEYIAFVDSDDRLANGCIHQILNWIDQGGADFCFMEGIKFYPNGRQEPMGDQIERKFIVGQVKDDVLFYIASRPKYPGSACTKLLRREFLLSEKLSFPLDRQHGEDLWFILQCLLKAKTYDALNIPYYEYRQNREGSVTHMVKTKAFVDLGRFVTETIQVLSEEKKAGNMIAQSLMSIAAYEFSIMLWQYSRLEKSDQHEALLFLKENKWVLQFGRTRKLQVIHALARVCGVRLTSMMLNFYMRCR